MKVIYILITLALCTSGSPQNNVIFFPDEFDNDFGASVPDDSIEYEDNGEYEDNAYDELEDFGFDGDYVELPEWMDTDLDELPLDKLAILNNVTEFTELSGFFEFDLDYFLNITERDQPDLYPDSRSASPSPSIEYYDDEDDLSGRSALHTFNRLQSIARCKTPGCKGKKKVVRKKRKRRRKNKKLDDISLELRLAKEEDVKATFAKCKPEKVTVPVKAATKNTLYIPSCVRLMRCGGCCNSKLLSCQPTKVENVTLTVMKIAKRGGKKLRGRRRRTAAQSVAMEMQNHVECKCDCKVQREDCDPELHNYNKAGCSCECKNGEEEMECQKSSALHKWDKKLCSCMCRKQKECSTGEIYSQDTCRCITANGGDA